ncbi:fatty acid desaturase family protein [Micromonospora sp. DT4]|uniref:fatty acid desaturase family protein n=1 Tax=Micromonospora sp. DT4 TaxID=3393438 RepID=UPI003CED23C7
MALGAVAEPPVRRRGSDYAQLSRRISQAGLLERRPASYGARLVLTLGAFVAGWVAVFLVGDSWWQVALAAVLAVATTQVAFLGHDAGHRQMFRRRFPSELVGLVAGNAAVGLSYGWWVDKHNRHHANPNHEDEDPDVGAGALVWTMGCAFAPNHKGIPMPTAEDELDFLRKQVLTSRNVRGSRLVDTALGGLNYQIEHHLFPNMPRANLRRAQPIVRAYCAEQGISYAETGLVESYRQALGHLHEVGRPLRG